MAADSASDKIGLLPTFCFSTIQISLAVLRFSLFLPKIPEMTSQVSDLSSQQVDGDLSNVSEVGADDNVFELQDFEFQVTNALNTNGVPELVTLNKSTRTQDLTFSDDRLTPFLHRPNSPSSDPTRENLLPQESAQSLESPNNASSDPAEKTLRELSAFENVKKTLFAKRFSGWRGGIALNAVLAGVVLLINVIILIWAGAKFKFNNGLATVFSGSCSKARNLELVAHLFINILSTLLLGASNYAMQVAASPSRAEVDNAHRQQKWVDIGVFSFRNFKWVSRYRLATYGILVLSSVPLHFL